MNDIPTEALTDFAVSVTEPGADVPDTDPKLAADILRTETVAEQPALTRRQLRRPSLPPLGSKLEATWAEQRADWREFSHANWIGIALCYAINIICLSAIGLVNIAYLDDTGRIMNGASGWGTAGSRWGSQIFGTLIGGSSNITDWGLTSFLLSALILATAGVLLTHTLLGKRATILSFTVASVLGLNPWFLNAAAFRIDGPLIAMSVLLAILPFIFVRSRWPIVFAAFSLSSFLVFNFYETSIGVTFALTTTLLLMHLLKHASILRKSMKRYGAAYLGSVVGFGLGLVQSRLQQQFGTLINLGSRFPTLSEIPASFSTNVLAYARRLYQDSNFVWRFSYVLVFVVFAIFVVGISHHHPVRTLGLLLLFAMVAFVASASFWLLLPGPVLAASPRYIYPFAMWITSLAVLVSGRWPPGAPPALAFICKSALVPFAFYMFSFPMIFAAISQNQYRTFVAQSTALMTDIWRVSEPGDFIALENSGIFGNSPSYDNARRNYPILNRLIYNNDEIWWANRNQMIELYALRPGAIRRVGEDSVCSQQNSAMFVPDIDSERWSISRLGDAETDWVDFRGNTFTGPLICVLSKPEGNRVDIGPAADSCVLPSRNEQQDNAIIGNFRRELPELRAANRDDTITAAEGICKAMLAGAVGNDLSIQFQSQFSFIEGFSIEPQQRETLGSWVIERNWCRCVDAG